MLRNIKLVKLKNHSDKRGSLFVIESMEEIPFEIKRIYYICGVPSMETRGEHAHKTLKQAMICLGGSCTIVIDDGEVRQSIELNNPDEVLILEPGLWREIKNFSHNATLMVLASEKYDENDYIRNYDEYLDYKLVKK